MIAVPCTISVFKRDIVTIDRWCGFHAQFASCSFLVDVHRMIRQEGASLSLPEEEENRLRNCRPDCRSDTCGLQQGDYRSLRTLWRKSRNSQCGSILSPSMGQRDKAVTALLVIWNTYPDSHHRLNCKTELKLQNRRQNSSKNKKSMPPTSSSLSSPLSLSLPPPFPQQKRQNSRSS